MRVSEMTSSKFLKQSDITAPTKVTIKGLKLENVARDDEEPEKKWTISFREFDKGMVLNKVNLSRLADAHGDETDNWIGKQVWLYVDEDVEFGGKVVGGLRLKKIKAPVAPATGPIAKVEAMRKASQPESENPAAGVDDDFDSIPF
jgi:hypothetical protein